ncbi:MAG: ABC transporter substrate-binding protein, partial [Lachnospiraceae bacterium]|nr:ABC transporter substrate-binding protein [Lachnospiraceae bacterium]
MKKRTLFLNVMALLVSAALCGCGGSKSTEASEPVKNSSEAPASLAAEADTTAAAETAEPGGGGSAVVGVTHDLVSLDPHQSTDARTRSVV